MEDCPRTMVRSTQQWSNTSAHRVVFTVRKTNFSKRKEVGVGKNVLTGDCGSLPDCGGRGRRSHVQACVMAAPGRERRGRVLRHFRGPRALGRTVVYGGIGYQTKGLKLGGNRAIHYVTHASKLLV